MADLKGALGARSGSEGLESDRGEEATTGDRRAAFLKLTALVVLVAGGILLARMTPLGDYLSREGVGRVVAQLRGSTWAPLIFVAIYAAATALAIPGTVLTLAGGALFGVFWGTVFNSVGANLGANAAFLVSRLLGRDGVVRLLGDRLSRLDRATRDHGFRGLLTLRLIPLVPFNALNFGSGLTAMSWPVYALATLIGILPGTIVYTMFADALLQGSQEASREALVRVLVSGGLLILLSFLPTILKKLHVKLPGISSLVALAALFGVLAPGTVESAQDRAPAGDLPDHGTFTALLQEVADPPRVDYARLQRERPTLDRYLDALATTGPEALEAASEDERLAFWVNAYNACMLALVADHYPLQQSASLLGRLKNALAGRPANSVWQIEDVFQRQHCQVAGEPRSQDEIEHEIIRPMGDPRIHFAVNCAAVSCPSLAREAYTGSGLDAQLDAQVRRFAADPRHFRLEPGDPPVLRLNKVLDWYGEDFGGEDGIRAFFADYLSGDRRERLLQPSTQVEYLEYDWTLNDVGR